MMKLNQAGSSGLPLPVEVDNRSSEPSQFERRKVLLLVVYAGSVYVSFILHDYLQELIWHLPGYRYPQFMTLFEFASCVVFPFVEIISRRLRISPGNPVRYAVLSALIVPSMVMGTAALGYVSYPIKVVGKSAKLIPTMVIGTLLLGRQFNLWHYVAAIGLCAGLAGFALCDSSSRGASTTLTGVMLLGGAVCLDAITPNLQQKLLGNVQGSDVRPSEAEMMMFTNLFGCCFLIPSSFLSGELADATIFLAKTPTALPLLVMFSITTYAGVASYLRLVSNFSGVTAVLVTTTRKVFTVVLSYLLFPRYGSFMPQIDTAMVRTLSHSVAPEAQTVVQVLSWGHVGSGFLVIMSIVLNEVARRTKTHQQSPAYSMTPTRALKLTSVLVPVSQDKP